MSRPQKDSPSDEHHKTDVGTRSDVLNKGLVRGKRNNMMKAIENHDKSKKKRSICRQVRCHRATIRPMPEDGCIVLRDFGCIGGDDSRLDAPNRPIRDGGE